jgi:hypothetical protein
VVAVAVASVAQGTNTKAVAQVALDHQEVEVAVLVELVTTKETVLEQVAEVQVDQQHSQEAVAVAVAVADSLEIHKELEHNGHQVQVQAVALVALDKFWYMQGRMI